MERTELEPSLKIGIVGGGIGGLALALGLKRKGISSEVFERDASISSRPQGYSLTLQQGLQVLEKLKVGPAVRASAGKNVSAAYETLASNGESLMYFDSKAARNATKETAKKKKGRHNLPVPRQALRQLLLDACLASNLSEVGNSSLKQEGEVIVHWSHSLERIVEEANGVTLYFQTSALQETGLLVRTFNIVVGCDGVHSKVRSQVLGDNLNYLGVMAILGIAPVTPRSQDHNDDEYEVVRDRVFQAIDGKGNRVFGKPFDESHAMWQLTFPIDEHEGLRLLQQWRRTSSYLETDAPPGSSVVGSESILEEAKRRLSGFHAPIPKLVEETPNSRVRAALLYDRDPMSIDEYRSRCKAERITFLGDAFHPMSPFKGQGANQALDDAWDLSDTLTKVSTQPTALSKELRRYEGRMIRRSKPKVLGSRSNVQFFHTPEALERELVWNHARITSPAEREKMRLAVEERTRKRFASKEKEVIGS